MIYMLGCTAIQTKTTKPIIICSEPIEPQYKEVPKTKDIKIIIEVWLENSEKRQAYIKELKKYIECLFDSIEVY